MLKNRISLLAIIPIIFILIAAYYLYSYFTSGRYILDATDVPKDVSDYVKNSVKSPQPGQLSEIKVPILLYHYVEYVKDKGDTIRQSLDIEPDIFDAQVKTLKDAGFTFITPSDFQDYLDSDKPLPAKPVVLSFDDGYRDFYTDVFPILKKYQAKAIAYIVTSFIDKPNNLTFRQLKEINESGLVEIGDHTVFHAYLKGLPEKRVRSEVEESKAWLEKMLGIDVVSFAYPYGVFDIQAVKIVQEAGFTNAVTTAPGTTVKRDEILLIPRIRTGKRTGKYLLDYLEQETYGKEKVINPVKAKKVK